MIIISVVSSIGELDQLLKNSFISAQELGFITIVVSKKNNIPLGTNFFKLIEVDPFASYGEANIAIALEKIELSDIILHVDPDEYYSKNLLGELLTLSSNLDRNEVGAVKIEYYFKNRKLYGTPWGGSRFFIKIGHKQKFVERRNVHERLMGQIIYFDTRDTIIHYWANNFEEIENKHSRYLEAEGSLKQSLYGTWNLKDSVLRLLRVHFGILRRINYRDGFIGLKLSWVFSFYAIKAESKFRSLSKRD